jgi:murein DD-endopeptidase MepM/ murein hydrolase activator NlpD
VSQAKPAQPKVAQNEPPPSANIVAPAADPLPEPAQTGTTGSSGTSFRWPVRGRVIQGFGPKHGGGQNDGINVAVPQGTPIKAAEDGVVAYAGSELKGYGNLVLVRHSNGFVTAYAHASELNVKKGDTIKRGQVIGKAGQTGNVASPQLHFEVRKGATPVDPTQYLSGG